MGKDSVFWVVTLRGYDGSGDEHWYQPTHEAALQQAAAVIATQVLSWYPTTERYVAVNRARDHAFREYIVPIVVALLHQSPAGNAQAVKCWNAFQRSPGDGNNQTMTIEPGTIASRLTALPLAQLRRYHLPGLTEQEGLRPREGAI